MFSTIKLIAHRANCDSERPENSLSGILAADANGVGCVECDVLLTADLKLVVFHDEELGRCTTAEGENAKKSISELTYAEILQYDLKNKDGKPCVGEKVPTLEQYLQVIRELNMGLLLEIKAVAGFEVITARITIEVLKKCGFDEYPKIILQSFLVECLQVAQSLCEKIPRVLLLEQWEGLTRVADGNILRYPDIQVYACKKPVEEIISELQCIGLGADYAILDEARINYIKEKLALPLLLAWTVNTPEDIIRLSRLGVVIISDHPAVLLEQKISSELDQYKIPKQAVDIVIHYLGLFHYNASKNVSALTTQVTHAPPTLTI